MSLKEENSIQLKILFKRRDFLVNRYKDFQELYHRSLEDLTKKFVPSLNKLREEIEEIRSKLYEFGIEEEEC